MIISIGEILVDSFPDYQRIGGAPFNFAYHLQKFGFPTRFISRVGNDDEGKRILDFLARHNFDTNIIQRDKTHSTGNVHIVLNDNGIPEFDIIKNVAYDHIEADPSLMSVIDSDVNLIYFGSLAQRTQHGLKTLQHILTKKDYRTKCLYDINLRPRCYSDIVILKSLNRADVLKLNDEELAVLKRICESNKNKNDFISFLMETFSIEMVALTLGERGSELFTVNGHAEVQPAGIAHIIDTVGAGDAFASILAIGYLNQWAPDKILTLAGRFASRICMVEGAIPPETGIYDTFKSEMMI